MKQNFNYHGHTKRCGHAVGEDEEYVQAAIAAGYSIIGFSDHAPYPGQYHAQERMDVGELDDYIRSIKELQQKYQGQIDIYIGMEIENYQAYKKELKQYRDMLDYCIIGQHSMALRDGNAVGDYYVENDDAHVLLYAGQIKEALEEGLAVIVAHPDLFMFGRREWNETCEMATEMICDAALKANAVLEVNLGGIKYGKRTLGRETRLPYPYRRFWEIVERKGNSVIYGLDVHAPQQYLQEDNFAIVDAVIQGLSLHFVDDLRFSHKL